MTMITLAVVVNLQDITAKTHDATALLRKCQLPEGQRAFAQGREAYGVSPEFREVFKKQQGQGK